MVEWWKIVGANAVRVTNVKTITKKSPANLETEHHSLWNKITWKWLQKFRKIAPCKYNFQKSTLLFASWLKIFFFVCLNETIFNCIVSQSNNKKLERQTQEVSTSYWEGYIFLSNPRPDGDIIKQGKLCDKTQTFALSTDYSKCVF